MSNLCACGCGQIIKSNNIYIHGHNRKGKKCSTKHVEKVRLAIIIWHKQFKEGTLATKVPSLCACGCRQLVKPNRRYLQGHRNRGRIITEECKRKISDKLKGVPKSEEARMKMRLNHHSRPRKTQYKGGWFRSGWEAKYAKWLDEHNIAWVYEKHVFPIVLDGKPTTYCPDFYLPELGEHGVYHEVKGWSQSLDLSIRKAEKTGEIYGVSLEIIGNRYLKSIGAI